MNARTWLRHAMAPLPATNLAGCPMDAMPDSRPPKRIRQQGNRLLHEPSLYLQQHAHNPVDWYPWGEEALQRARDLDRPVFLSIGYSSCHWCHVMEHEVFERDDVAVFLNERFVCIKVDREERPDLDAVYMDAVQLMTGRGGWPLSVFLTPGLKPFYGGTYFPRDQFLALCGRIDRIFREQRAELEAQAEEAVRRLLAQAELGGDPVGPVDRPAVAQAVALGKAAYDAPAGGFRQRQKFPTPVKWRFLLNEQRRTGDPELREMVTATCEAMARGGLYDHVGGGFHRYTVDGRWTVPHFEKMLYDNAQLASLYLEAGAALDRADFTAVAVDVLDFLLTGMHGPEGGFFSSLDADSDGREGTCYVWSRAEIAAVAGPGDGAALADVLGVDERGNFEGSGRSVLTRRAALAPLAARHGRAAAELATLFDRHRPALRRARARRPAPGLDRKVLTAWNGLAISALARAALATGRDDYLQAARGAARFLLELHRRPDGTLWRSSTAGRLSGEGALDDYAFLADGLLDLYQADGDGRWLAAAVDLAAVVRRDFARPAGGWHLARGEAEVPLGRGLETFDGVVPSGNAAFVNVLVKLAALTGQTEHRDQALDALAAFSGLLEQAGVEMAAWFDAAARLAAPIRTVVVAGDRQDEDFRALRRAFGRRLPPDAVLATVPPAGVEGPLAELAPALAGKTALHGRATAFVCEYGSCREPVFDAAALVDRLGAH